MNYVCPELMQFLEYNGPDLSTEIGDEWVETEDDGV